MPGSANFEILRKQKQEKNINKHLALDSILADSQHGFRSQRSWKTQLVQFVYNIISNLDGGVKHGHKQTDMIRMDLANFFDIN